MKKFFSLLLALTMVLSLVVVPARADDETEPAPTPTPSEATGTIDGTFAISGDKSISMNVGDAAVTLSASLSEGAKLMYNGSEVTGATSELRWTATGDAVTVSDGVVTAANAGTATVTCTLTMTGSITVGEGEEASTVTVTARASDSVTVTVTDKRAEAAAAFKAALSGITVKLNGREASLSGSNYKYEAETGYTWEVTLPEAVTGYSDIALTAQPAAGKTSSFTVTGKTVPAEGETALDVTATFELAATDAKLVAAATVNKLVSGGKTALSTGSGSALPAGVSISWTAQTGDTAPAAATATWTAPPVQAETIYTFIGTAKLGDTVVATSDSISITVVPDTFRFTVAPNPVTLTKLNEEVPLAASFENTASSPSTPVTPEAYSFTSSNSKSVEVKNAATAKPTLTLKADSANPVYITAKATYLGKEYTVTIPVTISLMEATLSAVQCGQTVTYSSADLISAAQTVLNNRNGYAYQYETVTSVDITTGATNYGTLTKISYTTGNYASYTFVAKNAIGTAQYAATVKTNANKTYSMTFNIPVKPYETTYADQYPIAQAYGNTYRYAVEVPAGYSSFYVVAKNAVSEPSDWSVRLTNTQNSYTASSPLYLTDADFGNTGKCVLHIVTYASTGSTVYSPACGELTVYQNGSDIEYTAVKGGTVKFDHDDFTNFLNEVSGSKTATLYSDYYSFNHVRFSTFTTSNQGTLYYNNTAMGSNSRTGFNSTTQITDLDKVSFKVNEKTTAKEITLGFTVYADRYSRTGTKLNANNNYVTFSGRVIINVVSEDVKITVAPGDVVKLDPTDFQTYLNNYSKVYAKSTVEYVTFDQGKLTNVASAPGALTYATNNYYSNTVIKSTDKFYYTARTTNTAIQQQLLSNVAFRAYSYAYNNMGETLYIPFTIKVANGSALVEGTLAVKIAQTMNFTDVKTGDYFYDAVKWAVNEGVTNGTTTTTFSPDDSCTRAQIVTFLWRAAGSPTPNRTTTAFKDVTAAHRDYATAIAWASEKGITTGTTATTFSPDAACTRAQIVTFLWRYAGSRSGYTANPFKDVSATTHASFYQAILWATNNGVAKGVTTTTFAPDATCTRAHAVTFLYNYLGN